MYRSGDFDDDDDNAAVVADDNYAYFDGLRTNRFCPCGPYGVPKRHTYLTSQGNKITIYEWKRNKGYLIQFVKSLM